MDRYLSSMTALAAVGILVLQWIIRRALWRRKYRFPNEVPGVPIFGNTFQIPPLLQGEWAKGLADKYGEMFTCNIAGRTWVFLNSSRVISDLMERRAAIYSSRQPMPMVQGIMSGNSRIVLMPYSERWRALRKIMHGILNARRGEDIFAPFQDVESRQLLHDYLHRPEKWFPSIQRFSNAVIMSVVFGRRLGLDDPEMTELFETSEEFLENFQPGANLVDGLPVLDKLPKALQWWRPRGERAFQKTRRVYKREVDRVIAKMAGGTARDCFATEFLKTGAAKTDFDETQILFTMGSLIEAGSDTSRIAIGQILAAAALYPAWVRAARAQLDAVCGPADAPRRIPSRTDRPQLPYITAVVKEGFRWRPFAEIGVPHMLTRDDEYEGFRFPAGTIFTYNAWAVALSEDEYEDPLVFKPERFLNEDLENPLKGHWAFGPGRRVCIGWAVGDTNVWIAIARILYCFDIDADPSRPIDSMHTNWAEHKEPPFSIKIKVRSEKHAALIDRECKDVVNLVY